MSITIARNIQAEVRSAGFSTAASREFELSVDIRKGLDDFRKVWGNLDFDKFYGGTGKSYRMRRYSDFSYMPATGELRLCEHVPYYQSERQNAYVGGKMRHFGDVTAETYENPFFKELVKYDFDQFPLDVEYRERNWICQVHQIRIVVGAGETTPVTPEGVHSDGYPFAGVHLMNRHNVTGGLSTVYTAAAEPLASLTFEVPLDSLFFEDRNMRHYVTPISAAKGSEGWRDILAISFSLPDSPYTTDV